LSGGAGLELSGDLVRELSLTLRRESGLDVAEQRRRLAASLWAHRFELALSFLDPGEQILDFRHITSVPPRWADRGGDRVSSLDRVPAY
jgi:hypothetical protein